MELLGLQSQKEIVVIEEEDSDVPQIEELIRESNPVYEFQASCPGCYPQLNWTFLDIIR